MLLITATINNKNMNIKNYFRIAFSSNYGNAVLWSNNN